MVASVVFLAPFSTRLGRRGVRNVANRGLSREPATCPRYFSRTTMIQRPDQDGPPDLDAFFDQKSKAVAAKGEPIHLGTGRALVENNGNDVAKTCLAALSSARKSIPSEPQLVHCTFSLDVDPHRVAQTLQENVELPILGRSINKKGASGTIEILLLSSGEEKGISYASATTRGELTACKHSAVIAASKALEGLSSPESCTFMVFSHSPGDDSAVREGLNEALPGVIAYGGPAVGNVNSGDGWALLGSSSVQTETENISNTVHVAAISGSLSFLYSAVIKSWVQPAFVKPLPCMIPSYVGDPQIDLLTAIRYNDWEKFIWCLETEGIDVNTTWKNKQNQSPLLAACARARTDMIRYLLAHGADVGHRNDGGFTASMYTRMLTEYDRGLILNQLKMLEEAGADTVLTEADRTMLLRATGAEIVE